MDRHLSAVKADPWLAQRIIAAERGEKPVKRKWSASMILAIALVIVTATGALAATLGAWGIIDFAGRFDGAYVPPKYEDCIKHENVTFETEHVTCTIRESYYDGDILRFTADIIPKEKTLLLGEGLSPDIPAAAYFPDPEIGEMTLGEAAQALYGGRVAEVGLYIPFSLDSSGDCLLNSDGSATVYVEHRFGVELPDRDVTLRLSFLPAGTPTEDNFDFDFDRQETADVTMAFHAAETKTFTCKTPMDFPSAGVQVTNVTLTVTPVEIRTLIDYTITDAAQYNALENILWFEFIDPESTAEDPLERRVSGGLTGSGSALLLRGIRARDGAVYRQSDSIGLDALGSEYTLCARSAGTGNWYESVTFRVEEAE